MDYKVVSRNLVDKAWEYTSSQYGSLVANLNFKLRGTVRLNFEKRYTSLDPVLRDDKLTYEKHLDELLAKNISKPHHKPSKTFGTISNYIDRIPMSKEKTENHEITYVVDRIRDKEENIHSLVTASAVQTINASEARICAMMTYWMKRAEEISGRKLTREYYFVDNYQATRFLIRGKPGVGKSALFNYLFSINAGELIESKIIWIRIALNTMDYIDLTLEDALTAKFLKIFCKYYLLEPDHGFDQDFIYELSEHLEKEADADPYIT